VTTGDDLTDHELTLQVHRTAKALRGSVAAALARYGCQPPQNLVLDALARTDGLTPGELSRVLECSGPTAVKMAQRMEANGLVIRRRDDPDERLVHVYLTERGRELQRPIAAAVGEIAERAFTGLDEPEKDALRRTLAVVRDNLAGCGQDPER
jgi:MarR family transcriptional regulator, organic hydroperoxide resistance regulator